MTLVSLADDVQGLKTAKPATFKHWLTTAPEHTRTEVLGYVYDEEVSANQLAELLSNKHNIPITRETIVRLRDSRR